MYNQFCILYPCNFQTLSKLNSINGSAIPCSKITLKINNCIIFQTIVDCSSMWQVSPNFKLQNGLYTIEAIQNFRGFCSSYKIIINICNQIINPNLKPVVVTPQNNTTITDNQPIISGIALPNSNVNISIEQSLTSRVPIDGNRLFKTYYTIYTKTNELGVYSVKVLTPLKNGTYYITVTQKESEVKTIIIVNIQIELNPPSITYPPNESIIEDNNPIITGTAVAGNIVTVCVDTVSCIETTANLYGLYSCQFDSYFKNGTYQLSANQTDTIGNISPDTINIFTVAKVIPPPTIVYPANNSTIKDNQPIITGYAIPENIVNICLPIYGCIESIANQNGTFSSSFPFQLPDSTYTLSATQTDKLGNVSNETISIFTINTSIPVPPPSIIYPENGSTISERRPTISGSGVADYSVEVCLSSLINYGCTLSNVNTNGLFNTQFSNLLPEGAYTIQATQIDMEGRRSITIDSNFVVEVVEPVPEPVPIYPENGSTISDNNPFFTGTGVFGNTVKLCLSTTLFEICKITTVDESGNYSLQFDRSLPDGDYTLTSTQIDGFGNESNSVITNFNVFTESIVLDTIESVMGPTFRSINLTFDISGTNNTGIAYYLLVIPGSEVPSISDMKNYPNNENLLNGTVARGHFSLNITPNIVRVTKTVYGKDGIIPLSGEVGIIDGYNYDAYIYVEISPALNSGVIGFGSSAMGMPFAAGNGSEDFPFAIDNLTNSQLLNYPDLLAKSPLNKSGVDENARMLENIERLEVLYDETDRFYGMINSLELNYILYNDIDLSNYANAYNGEGWIPIGNYDASYYSEGHTGRHIFSGVLDGDNYTISNLTMSPVYIENIKFVSRVGFIGYSSQAIIVGLNLDTINIIPKINNDIELYISSLIAFSSSSTITGVNISNVTIDTSSYITTNSSIYATGMIAYGFDNIIDGKYKANISSRISNVLIKSNSNSTTFISSMLGSHNVTGTSQAYILNYNIDSLNETNTLDYDIRLGGLVAYLENYGNLKISNISINEFNIKNNQVIGGGLIGYLNSQNELEINNITLNNIVLTSTPRIQYLGGLVGYLNNPNNAYNVSIHDISINNFDLSGSDNVGGLIGVLSTSTNSLSDFKLYNFNIGNQGNYQNLSVTGSNCGGIIGLLIRGNSDSLIYIYDGNVSKTNIVVGNTGGGGLIGGFDGPDSSVFTFIKNCICNVNIDASRSSNSHPNIGGLVGFAKNVALNTCSFSGDISSLNYAGGLIGFGESIYIGNSNANINLDGQSYIGGIAGYITYKSTIPYPNPPFNTKNATIEFSSATGEINTSNDLFTAGALVGFLKNSVLDQCFTKVNITSTTISSSGYTSMMISDNASSTISNSYSIGNMDVSLDSRLSSGVCSSNIGNIIFCYSSSTIVGYNQSSGICSENFKNISKCFALNPKVYGDGPDSARIRATLSGPLSQNYGIDTLLLYENGIQVTPISDPNGKDGANTRLLTLEIDMTNVGWSPDIWNFESIATLGRPTLKNNPEN